MSPSYPFYNGFSMTPDQIFVTDVGVDHCSRAFYWLAIGRHICDYRFNEITLRDLERQIDPNDVMNPVILRGNLWKTVSTRLWQVDDGHQLGPMPSQPGLDAYMSSMYELCALTSAHADHNKGVYYADRRMRQTSRVPSEPQLLVETTLSSATEVAAVAIRPNIDTLQKHHPPRRRTKSLVTYSSEMKVACSHRLQRRRSADHVLDDDELFEDEMECDEVPQYEYSPMMVDLEYSEQAHMRKYSVGLDSGIDVGYVDDEPASAYFHEKCTLLNRETKMTS